MASLRDATALADACRALVDALRQASGFDRVLFYQFLPDDDGEVLAEACGDAAQGSYLGLRFPASDIPQVARNLYVLNPWRTIPDAQAWQRRCPQADVLENISLLGFTAVSLSCLFLILLRFHASLRRTK